MPEVQTLNGFATLRTNVRLETIQVDTNLHAYRYTTQNEKLAHGGDVHPVVNEESAILEGITGDLNIAELTTAQASSDWVIVSDHGLELFRTVSFSLARNREPFLAEISHQPFTDLVSGNATVDNVVRFDQPSEMLFDRSGEPLPKALYGSYIEGGFDNENYDLEQAAAHLMARNDVFVAAMRGFTEPDMETEAISATDAIHDIPYYNKSVYRNRCLYLIWRPSVEDFRKAWKQANDYGQHPSLHLWRAVFDLDLLGLRAAGASKRDLSQA